MINLGKLNTNEGIDIIADLMTPVATIMSDEVLLKEIQKLMSTTEEVNGLVFMANLSLLIPKAMKRQKRAMCEIISIFKECSVEEVENQSIFQTVKDVNVIIRNKDIVNLFLSLKKMD